MSDLPRREFLRLLALPLAGLALGSQPGLLIAAEEGSNAAASRRWWKEAVVYQIYPRSFQDSNSDGIGDLPGILSRLDYLAALGVDVVWLCPHYASPNVDNGYDISDYRAVNPVFGTMADFDRLLAGLKARGIRLIVDLVVNHTSDQHAWFRQSRASRDNPYRDYYIWREAKEDGGWPSNYLSMFGGPAWTRDEASGQCYLHLFAPQQPDLNWDNPKVRAEVYDLMRFWLDKGVAGFRMDAATFWSKRPGLPDLNPHELENFVHVYGNGPKRDTYFQEINREVLSHYDAMTVGEAAGITLEQAGQITDDRAHELDMLFTFEVTRLERGDQGAAALLPQIRQHLAARDRAMGEHGWAASFLANHALPRSVSHFGDPDPAWREASAKALGTLLLTQRATAFVYQGEELGMTNYPFTSIDQFDDVFAKNEWRLKVLTGQVSAEKQLAALRRTSRDNARTPMQWTADAKGGFTERTPWLPINPNTRDINAAAQEKEAGSVLAHYRSLIALRKHHPVLVYGSYQDLDPDHPAVFSYLRRSPGAACLVLLNFARVPVEYRLPTGLVVKQVLLASRTDEAEDTLGGGGPVAHLPGWQSLVLAVEMA